MTGIVETNTTYPSRCRNTPELVIYVPLLQWGPDLICENQSMWIAPGRARPQLYFRLTTFLGLEGTQYQRRSGNSPALPTLGGGK